MLFSDIEGSTALLQRVGEGYDALLAEHRDIVRAAVARAGGTEVGTEGDSFFVVFESVPAAVEAAIEAQCGLARMSAAGDEEIRVRMGVHVGEVRFIGEDPVGLAVHLASRIASAAHGGQIIVSEPVHALCDHELEGLSFLDLGEHRLKDLQGPQRLFQVLHPELAEEFPPPRTLEVRRHNLPLAATSFIGRGHLLTEIADVLARTRLVTLTGSGGVGKTRLALQVGANVLEDFPGGVWLIDLAPVVDPTLVPVTVASALGFRTEGGKSVEDALFEHLATRDALLLLDNCEHLIDASASLADRIVRTCPGIKLIATSREPLRVDGEVAIRVPSLGLDAAGDDADEAVRLFAERAIAADPTFAMTPETTEDVRRICRRLDGIALAIELAAARVRAMSPRQIAERVEDRFRLLTGGSRAAMARQRTLRATVDWSYDLLDDDERTGLRCLSVFASGFALEDAESVCGSTLDIVDPLLQLVDRSLVIAEQQNGTTRYRLLETIRQYASEKLADSGESARMRSRHAAWMVALATAAEPELEGRDQRRWFDRMDAHLDNVRAALRWLLDTADGATDAAAIASSLWRLWWVRGYWTEGIAWLEAVSPRLAPGSRERGRVAWALGFLSAFTGAWSRGRTYGAEALAIARELSDPRLECYARYLVVFAGERDRPVEQIRAIEEVLALARELHDPQMIAWTLLLLFGRTPRDPDGVRLLEEAREIATDSGDDWSLGVALNNLAVVAQRSGDLIRGRSLLEESLALRRDLGHDFGVLQSIHNLASLDYRAGDMEAARRGFVEAERLGVELGAGDAWAHARLNLGLLDFEAQDLDGAERAARRVIEMLGAEEHGFLIARAWGSLAHVSHARGAFDEARESIEKALELAPRVTDPTWTWSCQVVLAIIEADSDGGDRAWGLAKTAAATALEGDVAGDGLIDLAENVAYVAERTGYLDEAVALLGAVSAAPPRQFGSSYPDMRALASRLQTDHPSAWERGARDGIEAVLRAVID